MSDFQLTALGQIVWEDRYGLKDENGNLVEKNILETFRRVAKAMASKERDPVLWEERFYDIMANKYFCPAGRILAHAGTHYSQLLNCFVLPFEDDSLEAIMDTAKKMAVIQKFGGGCIGGESIVLTNKGPLPIKHIVENPDNALLALSFNPKTKETEFCKILDRHTNDLPGNRVFEIKFKDNRKGVFAKMRASDWHPFFIFDGEKTVEVRADELKPGMAVIGSTDLKTEYHEWGWLLGYITGDGAVSPNGSENHTRIRINDDSEPCVQRAADIMGVPCKKHPDQKKYKVNMWCCESYEDIAEKIKNEFQGHQTCESKHIPISIWSSPPETRFSFLVGYLDSDGYYNKNKKRFEVFTVSKILAFETLSLAGSLGIRSSLRFRKSRRINESNGWEIRFCKSQFVTDAIIKVSAKREEINVGWSCGVIELSSVWKDKLINKGINVKTSEAWKKKIILDNNKRSITYWLEYGKASRETSAAILRECGENKLSNALLSCQIVDSVEPTGIPETLYDLTIDKNQTYISSDPIVGAYVIVHNTGFNYSTIRPAGARIKGVNGRSCGILGFMNMMSTVSEVIEQGGSRRGANLGLLEISHPDIWEYISYKSEHNWDHLREFIDIKDEEKWTSFKFENFYKLQMYNISVGITDEFLDAVKKDADWPLVWKDKEWELYSVLFTKDSIRSHTNFDVTADSDKTALWKVKRKVPYPGAKDKFEITGKRKIKASEIWNKICYNAWADGCPGLINISTARKFHNLEYVNSILSTNPCGEQPLGPYGSCNLSSIPLLSFYKKETNDVDYPKLRKVIHTAVRFADNVIDNCEFPIPEIKKVALQERRIGLGTMGIHDLLIKMKLGYDTEEGRTVVDHLLEFIRNEAYRASIEIAKEKGSFPLFSSPYHGGAFIKTLPVDIQREISGGAGIRNACLLSQAPTGTTGTLYNCSTGCEPWFALSFQRNTRLGSYEDGCPDYIEWKKENPDKPKPSYFKTSQEIVPEDHIKMLTLFSKFVDSSVSKCIAKGTLVNTNKGIFPIEQLSSGINCVPDTFYTPNNNYKILDENGVPRKISKHYYGGEKHCFCLKFDNGFELTAAETHLLKTSHGWISFKDIQKGDRVFYRTNGIKNEAPYVSVKQPIFKKISNTKTYSFPKTYDENFAMFLGMWLADGSANKNSLSISEKNDTVKEKIEFLIPILFGTQAKIYVDKRFGVRNHVLNSRTLTRYFKENYGSDCVTKKVPEEILRSPDSVQKAFLSGLSLDGYKKRNNLVIYEGYSKQIAEAVSFILSSHGIKYYIGEKYVKTGRKSKIAYSIYGYFLNRDFVTPVEPHKKNYSIATTKTWPVFVPAEIRNQAKVLPKGISSPKSTQKNFYIARRNLRYHLTYKDFTRQGLLEKCGFNVDMNLRYIKVLDKTDAGILPVYDIEVEETHSYLINGVVSHNTINMPNSASVEDVKKAFEFAMEQGAKGITIFRDGSKEGVLVNKDAKKEIIEEAKECIHELQGLEKTITEDSRAFPIQRGNIADGSTYRIPLQHHNLYVTVNKNDDGKLVEVFAVAGKSKRAKDVKYNGVENSWAEALGRLASLCLRAGVDPCSIISNLKNITSDKPVFGTIGRNENSELIPSPPHAIARVMEEELNRNQPQTVISMPEKIETKKGFCAECGSSEITPKGPNCYECQACGYSGCGS